MRIPTQEALRSLIAVRPCSPASASTLQVLDADPVAVTIR
jgi:hypothetical protein